MGEKQTILRHYFIDGWGIKKIARDLGFARNTVRDYVREFSEQKAEILAGGDKYTIIEAMQDGPKYDTSSRKKIVVKESRKKLTKAKRRREEINSLIKKLYESYAAEKIPEKHFTELLAGYDTEQAALDTEIGKLQTAIDSYNTDSVRADKFIELVKSHTEFKEFSAALLNEFVEKVIVHEAVKVDGVRTMKADIHLTFIGKFELPEWEEIQIESAKQKGTKKLRRDMTEEERTRERERDRVRYAKKVAAKKAAEQAQRAEILKGTSFEIAPQEIEADKPKTKSAA